MDTLTEGCAPYQNVGQDTIQTSQGLKLESLDTLYICNLGWNSPFNSESERIIEIYAAIGDALPVSLYDNRPL